MRIMVVADVEDKRIYDYFKKEREVTDENV